jgi:hypothetical protein
VGKAAHGAAENLTPKHAAAFPGDVGSLPRNCLPKKAFPRYPSAPRRRHAGPSSSHNDEGTRFGHVRAANADHSGGECAGVRGRDPCTGAKCDVERYRQIFAYTATPNGKKLCFALAKPSSSKTNPPNRPRDPAYAFVSTRPAEKVTNEFSIMIGYALKPGSESTLQVGGATYAMYTQGDGLWIKNAAEEERMVEAMRKAADVVVKGVSAKGTETIDTFSMKGLSQALDRLAQDCRR